MRRIVSILAVGLLAAGACLPVQDPPLQNLAPEAELLFLNLSANHYAALQIRPGDETAEADAWIRLPLLPPSGIYRESFFELFDRPCPNSIDLRLLLYRRVNQDIPIGLDEGEEVEATPVVAGEALGVPACAVTDIEVYSIINWEAPGDTARVKIGQDTGLEAEIIRRGTFLPNTQGVWDIDGVDASLADAEAPWLLKSEPIGGKVVLADGTGLEDFGVLLRTFVRRRLDELGTPFDPNDPHDPNDPNYAAGWSLPIDVAKTDPNGLFAFERPAGIYRVEVFADGYVFRPYAIDVETPQEQITFLAEPE